MRLRFPIIAAGARRLAKPLPALLPATSRRGARPAAAVAAMATETETAKAVNAALGLGAIWGVPEGPCPRPRPGECVPAAVTYQGDDVPRGLDPTGQVKTIRDGSGSDGEYVGCDFVRRDVQMANGRDRGYNLDDHGFALVSDVREHIDYKSDDEILPKYYPACEALVKRVLGAAEVYAFDHNVRSAQLKRGGEDLRGGNAVQAPLFFVHNDYSRSSAPRRIRDLSNPPKHNDTLRKILGDKPLIDPARVEDLMTRRWAFVNVWRNIKETPVQMLPLGMCEGASVPVNDIVTFEIHYKDRIGENYFARHTASHRWAYFPDMTRDEAVLLKCWDSRGRDFAPPGCEETVPATFSLHTAFEDPSTLPNADDRESIEVRTVAFF